MTKVSKLFRPAVPFAAAVLLVAAPLSSHAAKWSITDLGAGFEPVDINDEGTVLQRQQTIDGKSIYFTAINNFGQAVGWDLRGGNGYLYDKGILTPLTGMRYASDINDKGQVIGTVCRSNCYAAIWNQGTVSLPIGSQRYSEGLSINESGQILGWTNGSTSDKTISFAYDGVALTAVGLGGSESYGSRINDRGAVAGYAKTTMDLLSHAFLYDHGAAHDLGTFGGWSSSASDVNNRNDVVGRAEISLSSNETHAFLYRDGSMIDLALLPEVVAAGWTTLSMANAVNERGQIVGFGVRNGVASGFLLQAAAIPEPGTLALSVAGLMLLGVRRAVHRARGR